MCLYFNVTGIKQTETCSRDRYDVDDDNGLKSDTLAYGVYVCTSIIVIIGVDTGVSQNVIVSPKVERIVDCMHICGPSAGCRCDRHFMCVYRL